MLNVCSIARNQCRTTNRVGKHIGGSRFPFNAGIPPHQAAMPRWGGYADFQQFIKEAELWDEAPCSRGRATCRYTIMLGLRLLPPPPSTPRITRILPILPIFQTFLGDLLSTFFYLRLF